MSVAITNPETEAPSLHPPQPFQCHVCLKRFTRHENLKRHAAVHARAAGEKTAFTCNFCQITFSRIDLQRRHVRRKHPDQVENQVQRRPRQEPAASGECSDGSRSRRSKSGSVSSPETSYRLQPQQNPLNEAGLEMERWGGQIDMANVQHQLEHDDQTSTSNPPTSVQFIMNMDTENEAVDSIGNYLIQQSSMTEPIQIASFEQNPLLSLSSQDYETETGTVPHHFVGNASLDRGSVRSYIPDGLSSTDVSYLQDDWFPSPSQASRGYYLYFTHVSHFVPFIHRATFDATETARHLGLSMLSLAYQHGEDPDCGEQAGSGANLSLRCFHRGRVLAASEEEVTGDLSHKITLVQSYWLLQVCVMMYICGEESIHGLKIHSRMISLVRFGGLTQAISVDSDTTEDLDALWRSFIKAESHKRTLLAVHQIDALWYQLFSIPRLLSHLEIKHDLPCPEEYWTTSSSGQWAHRQLAAKQSATLVPYSDAVRCFLSPDSGINTLPVFDLYGAVNIAQFLLSSAREISGWSTMTGRFSSERFEPLRSSLFALERLIRPEGVTIKSTHAVSCEATWEMAMIELLIWSSSHIGGIVGGSVDAFLAQSTYLASSCKIMNEEATTSAVQPHIDWFLRHLENTLSEDSEPPWITLYAYKAFLIAWQLLHEGVPGAMQVVGVHDSDVHGAIVWAKRVFHSRHRQQLSKLIISCLNTLDT